MKKHLFLLLISSGVATAQFIVHPGTTNTSTVVLTTTNNSLLLNGVEHYNAVVKSNSFSSATSTNGLSVGDFRLFNSNGVPVLVWNSNGTPVISKITQ